MEQTLTKDDASNVSSAQARAVLRGYLHSPQKTRLTVNAIRGKSVNEARRILAVVEKKAAAMVEKVLRSAIANAKDIGLDESKLKISEIKVDGGKILYRSMPRARGRATPKRKRTSHITITLSEKS